MLDTTHTRCEYYPYNVAIEKILELDTYSTGRNRGKAYAQDLFTAMFENNPMSREVGMRYRKTVLEPGGSRNGMDLLEEFLGRKPNSSARYKELGLLNK